MTNAPSLWKAKVVGPSRVATNDRFRSEVSSPDQGHAITLIFNEKGRNSWHVGDFKDAGLFLRQYGSSDCLTDVGNDHGFPKGKGKLSSVR